LRPPERLLSAGAAPPPWPPRPTPLTPARRPFSRAQAAEPPQASLAPLADAPSLRLSSRRADRPAPPPVKVTWAPAENLPTAGNLQAAAPAPLGKRSASGETVETPPACDPQPAPKRPRPHSNDSDASEDAVALGYEVGTIKHSAYVLLLRAGLAGLTVSAIVDTASRAGMYSWGSCKTPNNSVTAALSQDPNFQRVAPSTYALRDTLRPVGAAAAREAAACRAAAVAAAAERGETLPPEHKPAKPRHGGAHRVRHRPHSGARAQGGGGGGGGGARPRPSANTSSGPSSSGGGGCAGGACGGEELSSPRRPFPFADFGCLAELDCGNAPACSVSLYPPNSPPTPEDERVARLFSPRGRPAGGEAGLASPAEAGKRREAVAPSAPPPFAPASPLLVHETPAPTRAPRSEAAARAERWRSEACGWRRKALLEAGPPAAALGLPRWVVAAYLSDKEPSHQRDSFSSGDGTVEVSN